MQSYELPESIYQHYVYSYPHKTAYRQLQTPIPLSEVWEGERLQNLFLYLHVPFCEFRCGFCNLFTRAVPPAELPDLYLRQLRREAQCLRDQLPDMEFDQIAIGGGTPTYLNLAQLGQLFEVVDLMAPTLEQRPFGIECSPSTLDQSKLDFLIERGVERVSMGLQSFSKRLCNAMGRPQEVEVAHATLRMLKRSKLPRLNVDLIYGVDGQSPDDFVESIQSLLEYIPEEIFLYPLYIRPLTGLGNLHQRKVQSNWDFRRLECYRAGRDYLLANGYHQKSMRMFSRNPNETSNDHSIAGTNICSATNNRLKSGYQCQVDGMVGLGCGARSYTSQLHYSLEYAVGRTAVHAIIDDYIARDEATLRTANYGFELSPDEQMRRFVLMSLLQKEGLPTQQFSARFGHSIFEQFPELDWLIDNDLAQWDGELISLTDTGLERSDQIGPFLFSPEVLLRMGEYQCV